MITAVPNQAEPSDNEGGPAVDPAKGIKSHLIDNVGVRLEAYLGGAPMTVGELAALAAGSVVPLDASLAQSVELRLNGVAVAKGELVSVGDKFAVRLIEVSA